MRHNGCHSGPVSVLQGRPCFPKVPFPSTSESFTVNMLLMLFSAVDATEKVFTAICFVSSPLMTGLHR